MVEQRNEVRHELAAVREDLGNPRATVEAMSRPSMLASVLKLWGTLSGTQWRCLGTAVLLLTGAILRLDPIWISKVLKGALNWTGASGLAG
jgi:hypothetical protein